MLRIETTASTITTDQVIVAGVNIQVAGVNIQGVNIQVTDHRRINAFMS